MWPQTSMNKKRKEKMDTYSQKCSSHNIRFLPCVTSALGGFSKDTVEKLLKPMAQKLAHREGLYITQAKDRIVVRLQSAILKQIAKNGMDFMSRHGFQVPEVVELDDQDAGSGLGGI